MADHAVHLPNGLETDDVQVKAVEEGSHGVGYYDDGQEINGWGEIIIRAGKEGTDTSGKHDKADEAVQEGTMEMDGGQVELRTDGLESYDEPGGGIDEEINGWEEDRIPVEGINEETDAQEKQEHVDGVVEEGTVETDHRQVDMVEVETDGLGNLEPSGEIDEEIYEWGENKITVERVKEETDEPEKQEHEDEVVEEGTVETDHRQDDMVEVDIDGLGNCEPTGEIDEEINEWRENKIAVKGVKDGIDEDEDDTEGTDGREEQENADEMVQERTMETDDRQVERVEEEMDGLGNYDEPDKVAEQRLNELEKDEGEANEEMEGASLLTMGESAPELTNQFNEEEKADKAVQYVTNELEQYFEPGQCGTNELEQYFEPVQCGTNELEQYFQPVQCGTNELEQYFQPIKVVPAEENLDALIDFTKEEIHIKKIEIGSYEIDTTYPSAHPDQLNKHSYVDGHLFACEFCLQFTDSPDSLNMHKTGCTWTQPCGSEVYNKGDISVFEVDGTREQVYCECLCLISKLFLDNKRKECTVEEFVFYVLTINDLTGKHLAGYFSKEKAPNGNHNVSCLLVLPHYQRQGLGRFLIDFSYLFSRMVKVPGTPERPLSSLGMISYQSYWKNVIAEFLYKHITERSILIKTISEKTGIDPYDIGLTLQMMNLVKHRKNKVSIVVKQRVLAEYMEAIKAKNHIILDEECLQWTPWVQEIITKETGKSSRLLRGNEIHNFPIVKNETAYFSPCKSPPCKIAK